MSQYVSGNTVRVLWTVLNESNAVVTGITTPADVTFTLHRESGSAFVAASETVSWAEIGVSGSYTVSFTPQNTGRYTLQLQELGGDAPLGRRMNWDFDVLSAGSVFTPSLSNAFCAESDIERYLQQSITSSTKPSSTEAAGFAEGRAAMLISLCARLGYSQTPTTVTNGSVMQDLLREANAIGAALDYTVAQAFGTGPSKTDRATWLQSLWDTYFGKTENGKPVDGLIAMEIGGNLVSLGTDHILSGDTIAATVTTPPTDIGIQVTMGDAY